VTDGSLLYERGSLHCQGRANLSRDGSQLFRVSGCNEAEIFRAQDGDRLGALDLATYDENGVTSPGVAWDESHAVFAISLDSSSITLGPFRGGHARRVRLPASTVGSPPTITWLPSTSQFFIHRVDGLIAIVDSLSGGLRILDRPSVGPLRTPLSRLSLSGDQAVVVTPGGRIVVWSLPSGKARDLGVTLGDWDGDGAFIPAPDGRFVAVGREGALDLIPFGDGGQEHARHLDLTNIEDSYSHFIGWGENDTFIVVNAGALLAVGTDGTTRVVVPRLGTGIKEVRLLPNRRAVVIRRAGLSLVRLMDGEVATLVQTGTGSAVKGRIEGIDSDAEWATKWMASAGGPTATW
jgi:hypothetical protein